MTAVLYYSFSGSTRALAEKLALERGADLLELKERKKPGMIGAFIPGCPRALKRKGVQLIAPAPLTGYDTVVLMCPVWAGFPAPAFNSALLLLPQGCAVELILVSGGGETSKSKAGTIALLESLGHKVLSYQDVATAAGKPANR